MTDEEILKRANEIKLKRAKERMELAKKTDSRVMDAHNGKGTFKLEELRFAAFERCVCGYGMAYPRDVGFGGAWECSAILRGIANRQVRHCDAMPFAVWAVKSEDSMADIGKSFRELGMTTRPEK